MTNVLNFIRWTLTHVDPNTVPRGVVLANGTVRASATPSRIKERWENYYSSHGWAEASYIYLGIN